MPTPSNEIRRVQADYIKLRTNTEKEILRFLKKADLQIRMILADNPSDFQIYKLPQLKLQIAEIMTRLGGEQAAVIASRTAALWETGQELITAPLKGFGTANILLSHLDDRQLFAMKEFLTDKMRDVNTRIINKVNTQLGLSMIGGQTINTGINKISEAVNSEKWRAKAVLRTELGRVYNIAAQQRLNQAAAYVPELGKMWIKSKKAHPRENHAHAHRQIVSWNGLFTINGKHGEVRMMHPKDPAAPAAETINCGCTFIPYHPDWGLR